MARSRLPNLATLIADIDQLSTKGHQPTQERLDVLGKELADLVSRSLNRPLEPERPKTLRMSNLGKPDRQLWYELKSDLPKEQFSGNTLRKFLFGDLWESLLLFLAEEAGHKVEHKQGEVEVDGIVGHIDAIVDDVVVDVKSASSYAFKKFKNGTLQDDDPFGYYDQLGGYSHALDLPGAWLAIDKQTGSLALLEAPKADLEALDTPGRIEHMKGVLDASEPPERCYEPVPEGKSGNMKLSTGCSYCAFKQDCWKDSNGGLGLRTFIYSTGPVSFVHIEAEPRTQEITF